MQAGACLLRAGLDDAHLIIERAQLGDGGLNIRLHAQDEFEIFIGHRFTLVSPRPRLGRVPVQRSLLNRSEKAHSRNNTPRRKEAAELAKRLKHFAGYPAPEAPGDAALALMRRADIIIHLSFLEKR